MSTDFLKCIDTKANKILMQKGKTLKIVTFWWAFSLLVSSHTDFYYTNFLKIKTGVWHLAHLLFSVGLELTDAEWN